MIATMMTMLPAVVMRKIIDAGAVATVAAAVASAHGKMLLGLMMVTVSMVVTMVSAKRAP